jgi:hypothetical protein
LIVKPAGIVAEDRVFGIDRGQIGLDDRLLMDMWTDGHAWDRFGSNVFTKQALVENKKTGYALAP